MPRATKLEPLVNVIEKILSILEHCPGKKSVYYAIGLRLFLRDNSHSVGFDELKQLTTSANDAEAGVRKLIFRLKAKLRPFGYTIRSRTIYEIVPLDET